MWYQPYDATTGARFGAASPSQGVLPDGFRYFAMEAEPIAELYEWRAAEFRYVLRHAIPRIVSTSDFLDQLGDVALEELEHMSVDRAGDSNPLGRKRAKIRAWLRRVSARPSLDLNNDADRAFVSKLETLGIVDVAARDKILTPAAKP